MRGQNRTELTFIGVIAESLRLLYETLNRLNPNVFERVFGRLFVGALDCVHAFDGALSDDIAVDIDYNVFDAVVDSTGTPTQRQTVVLIERRFQSFILLLSLRLLTKGVVVRRPEYVVKRGDCGLSGRRRLLDRTSADVLNTGITDNYVIILRIIQIEIDVQIE